ncbi:hypothetical protein N7495_008088 [Penicillium taxi]|uniref:uncharacterized protein n=1 Tax=Penicillium taxi TaxID=168475 RepID=UPI002545B6D9|nr:uncharacterized protein N7495_008088 [Penicillium taxi]KAJ5888047.1 hypothetical protein N7495_008088 [Penicillium taxi]
MTPWLFSTCYFKKDYFQTSEDLPIQWQMVDLLENNNESSPLPHAIMETIAHTWMDADAEDQNPTIMSQGLL